jgi:pimeloyl-ACP methyl ester carboxylesterase
MTATNIETGELVRFSNRTHKLTPEHLMASGALPPSFPPVLIDGSYYWDGGLYDNTPIQSVLRILNEHEIETLPVFVIEVFSSTGAVPRSMTAALDRMTELVYEDKFWKMFEGPDKALGFADVLSQLDKMVGKDHPLRQNPHFAALMHYRAISHVFTIHARNTALSGVSDFSSVSVESRLSAGYQATTEFLKTEEANVEALLARGLQAKRAIDPASSFESDAYVAKSFLTSDKLRLTYREYGSDLTAGPVVLALPGLTLNVRDFDPMASILGDEYRVFTLNLRGRDTSDYDPHIQNYCTPVYIRDIYEFWQHLNVGPVVLLGTSLGGVLAMLMAEDHPDMLAGVILNDVGAALEPAGMLRIAKGYSDGSAGVADIGDLIAGLKVSLGGQFAGLGDQEWERIAHSIYDKRDGTWQHRCDSNIGRAMIQYPEALRDLWAAHRKAADLGLPILSLRLHICR